MPTMNAAEPSLALSELADRWPDVPRIAHSLALRLAPGFDWAWTAPAANAVHKSKPARIVRMSSLHPLATSSVIA